MQRNSVISKHLLGFTLFNPAYYGPILFIDVSKNNLDFRGNNIFESEDNSICKKKHLNWRFSLGLKSLIL